jgi:hypothetical protein
VGLRDLLVAATASSCNPSPYLSWTIRHAFA